MQVSFEQAKRSIEQVRAMCPNIVIVLVANKSDLVHHVQTHRARAYAAEAKLLFTEASAKESYNVHHILEMIGEWLCEDKSKDLFFSKDHFSALSKLS